MLHYLQEMPLVAFTLLAQLAVGIVLAGQCVMVCGPAKHAGALARKQTLFAFVFFVFAALISLGHTGTPLHSPFTILHIASSWLSREIAAVGATGFFLLLLAICRLKAQPSGKEGLLSALVIIAGLVLCFVMSNIYNRPFMPGWNNFSILPSFLASLFMLGAAWQLMVISIKMGKEAAGAAKPLAFWAVLGFIVLAASLPLAVPDAALPANPVTLEIPYRCIGWSLALHGLVSGLGVLLIVIASLRSCSGYGLGAILTVPAFILLVLGEVFGRLVFYLSYSRLGM